MIREWRWRADSRYDAPESGPPRPRMRLVEAIREGLGRRRRSHGGSGQRKTGGGHPGALLGRTPSLHAQAVAGHAPGSDTDSGTCCPFEEPRLLEEGVPIE